MQDTLWMTLVSTHFVKIIKAIACIRSECMPIIRALSRDRDPRTCELALEALQNLGEENCIGNLTTLVESIGVTNAKSMNKKLASDGFDLPLLLDPNSEISDIVNLLSDTDGHKRGDILRLLTEIRILREKLLDDISEASEISRKAADRHNGEDNKEDTKATPSKNSSARIQMRTRTNSRGAKEPLKFKFKKKTLFLGQ